MQCIFEDEIKAGMLVCDYGGMTYSSGVEVCPTFIFNMCQDSKDYGFVPETIDWCKEHYVPPCAKRITCEKFGECDGMDGGCWWCLEMYPYQWHMCSDERWVRGLMSKGARFGPRSRSEAAQFIEDYKQRLRRLPKETEQEAKEALIRTGVCNQDGSPKKHIVTEVHF